MGPLATDLNLVFENAKQYNADESKIYKVRKSINLKYYVYGLEST